MRNADYFNSKHLSALSHGEIARRAPAVFAEVPHSKTSDNYLFLPTIKIVEGLQQVGWEVVAAKQTGNMKTTGEKRDTNKHALFLARRDSLNKGASFGDSLPLVKLENAHNGSSAFGLSTGFFRVVCANGLTVPDSIYSAPRVRHTLGMIGEAQQATLTVLKDFPRLIEMRNALNGIELTQDEKMLFGDAAADIFYSQSERRQVNEAARKRMYVRGTGYVMPLEQQLVSARRYDDRKADLWTTMNVVQENLIRGNVLMANETATEARHTRKVTSIDRDNDIHQKLFLLTQKFAELKGVKIGLTA
jgi:hypothetical protein